MLLFWRQLKPYRNRRSKRYRQSIANLILASLVFSFSLPLPIHLIPKASPSLPYPCQERGCGCGSYEECWSTCRCQKLEDKIEWAISKGAPIPEGIIGQSSQQTECDGCCQENEQKGPDETSDISTRCCRIMPKGCSEILATVVRMIFDGFLDSHFFWQPSILFAYQPTKSFLSPENFSEPPVPPPKLGISL